MKRKVYRRLQQEIQQRVVELLADSKGSRSELTTEIRHLLQEAREISFPDLMDYTAGTLLAAAKQELRKSGVIEIGRNGISKLSSELNAEDIEAITLRRQGKCHGMLRNSAVWLHQQGKVDDCRKCLQMLSVMEPSEAEELEKQLFG